MDGAGKKFLACAGFAVQQNGCGAFGHVSGLFHHARHDGAAVQDAAEGTVALLKGGDGPAGRRRARGGVGLQSNKDVAAFLRAGNEGDGLGVQAGVGAAEQGAAFAAG